MVAISGGVQHELASYFAMLRISTGTSVIENGIATEYYAGQEVRLKVGDPIRVLAVGTLDERKNFGLALEILVRIRNAELTILGSGSQLQELELQARGLGIEDRVFFEPAASDVRGYFDRHDLLLNTSVREGFGLVAAEAMARGLPVVAPRIPGIRDVVLDGESGVLFNVGAGAAAEAAQIINYLASDIDTYRRMSAAAISVSRRFDIRTSAARHGELYRKILIDRAGASA